jgi:hypothetical protein
MWAISLKIAVSNRTLIYAYGILNKNIIPVVNANYEINM